MFAILLAAVSTYSQTIPQNQVSRTEDSLNQQVFTEFINGTTYEQMGNFYAAAEHYQRALAGMPKSTEIRMALSEMLYQLQRYDLCTQNLLEIRPPVPEALELLGMAYRGAGNDDSAFITFRRLVKIDSSNSTGYSFLASYFRYRKDLDSTIWAYRHLIRIHQDNYRLPMELGRLLTDAGRLEEAKEAYRSSLQLANNATTLLAWTGLAEVYQAQDSMQRAREMFLQAVQNDSMDVVTRRDLSDLYFRLDSIPQAVAHARKASELAPFDRRLSRRLGAFYFGMDSLRLADSVLSSVIQSGEETPFDHYYLGRVAAAREEYTVALDHFKWVANVADTMPESWIDIGAVYRRMQQPEQEIEIYRQGLGHMRDDSSTYRMLFVLGAAYERNGQIEQATATFEELIAKSPDNATALNYLGYMLADKGQRLDYARDLIERAVKLSPDNAAYLDSFGWVYFRLGKYPDALIHLKKASGLTSDPVIFDHLGDVYSATGNKDEARRWWQKALELDPKNAGIQEKLAR
jgi:tetratricopeptide (TPR) repeat protein